MDLTVDLKEKQKTILETLTNVRLLDTVQVANVLYADHGSPAKRASAALHELENLRLVEGRRREIGKAKVWRLSNKGRKLMGIEQKPPALAGLKVDHHLAIADCYLKLSRAGTLKYWTHECREQFGKKVYAPDAFFVWEGKPFLLEVQRSPLSSARWGEKWAMAAEYFDGGHYRKSSWQFWKPKIIRPNLLCLSDQNPSIILAGTALQIHVGDDIISLVSKFRK